MELTPEEIEKIVLDECKIEAFWRRGLPMSVLTGTLLFQAIYNRRIFAKYYKYNVPISIIGAFFGKVLGEITYTQICIERLEHVKKRSV